MAIPIFTVPQSLNSSTKIIYSDTVLQLKDLGNNLNITKIENINENDFDDCLKIIFESNKDVFFNTIQYSRKNKTIYFYTNHEISIKNWNERNCIQYKPLNNNKEILEEIKSNLLNEKDNDKNHISLYSIANLIRYYETQYEQLKEKYTNLCELQLRKDGHDTSIVIYDFDYEDNQLEISYKDCFDKYKDITFKKQNNDLYIVKSEMFNTNKVLISIGKYLSDLYDEFMKFKDFKSYKTIKRNIKPVNSNFLVSISEFGAEIYNNEANFKLRSNYGNADIKKYYYDCNSANLLEFLKENEDTLFKNIYVNIKDCPKWSQEELYQIRNNELEKEKLKKEQQLQKELKNQKKLSLKRKFFPWTKK